MMMMMMSVETGLRDENNHTTWQINEHESEWFLSLELEIIVVIVVLCFAVVIVVVLVRWARLTRDRARACLIDQLGDGRGKFAVLLCCLFFCFSLVSRVWAGNLAQILFLLLFCVLFSNSRQKRRSFFFVCFLPPPSSSPRFQSIFKLLIIIFNFTYFLLLLLFV